MDLSVITTYRCDSKCSMCYIWKNPTHPSEELNLATLDKLPGGFDNVNITGGEPTNREDLHEIVEVLFPRARVIEISSNGLHADKLVPIIKKFPYTKVRFSLEGFGELNNRIRGEKDGFNIKVEGLLKLKEAGGKDLGFATVIQDDNVDELVKLYEFALSQGFELSTSALHNAFQFHKNDNFPYERIRLAKEVEKLVAAMLGTYSVKNWFRAYMNLGLIKKILGQDRLIPCTAASDFAFIDPWSDVYACNVRPDLLMGNLTKQTWEGIMSGSKADAIRKQVAACTQNCWMVTTARTAMRSAVVPQFPKLGPLMWVMKNKMKLMLGRSIHFDHVINYSDVRVDNHVPKRVYFLDQTVKRTLQHADDPHYTQGEFYNR